MLRAAASLIALSLVCSPAAAMVGGAGDASPSTGSRHVVMLVGSRGNLCTATALARDVVLTAAHCVAPGADYKVAEFFGTSTRPSLKGVARIVRHTQFSPAAYDAHRATVDLALVKLAEPLASNVTPATLGAAAAIKPGDRFIVTGLGVASPGDGRSSGTARSASLAATGTPGGLQLRLVDPATRNARPGLGACTGDSGAPVFAASPLAVVGVVTWSTAANNAAGCGGLTGVTPIGRYRPWIVETLRKLAAE